MADRNLNLKLIINGEYKAGDAVGKTKADVQSISAQLTTLQNRMSGLLALKFGEIISGQVGALVKTADAYKTLDARLKLVSDTSAEYATAQDKIYQVAQDTHGQLAATANVYGKIETAMDSMGGTQEQAIKTTRTLNQAIALTSEGLSQDAAAILQFSQGLGSGVLRGDEFNSVMENSPALAQALADGLGVPIGKLREMAEAGELTSSRLINALGKSADSVEAKFNALPLTVGGAVTKIGNAITRYIGEEDRATGASAKLANTISTVADNLDTVVKVVVILAELYGVKVVLGLSRSTQAFIENAQAARVKSAADLTARQSALALMQTEAQVAAIRQKATAVMVQEAGLYARLVAGSEKEAAAKAALAVAINQHQAAANTAKTKQLELSGVLNTTNGTLTKTERAFNAVNSAMQLAFAFEIGQTVGEWLRQFDAVRTAGSYLAETMAMVGTGVEGMLNNMSLSERWAQIKQIHADFDQIRAEGTVKAQQDAATTATAEEQKTQAIETSALKQQQSFKVVEEATKALTASIAAEAKAQTAAIEQSLAERLAAIDATNVSETEKDNLRVQAKLQAYQLEQQLQQQASTAKLTLIDQEYQAELAEAANNAERTAAIETQKRQAKLAVYSGLAEYYQGEVGRLSQVYAGEFQAAMQAKQQLQALNQSHEEALFNISIMGMTEREKLDAKETEYNRVMSEAKTEQAKGAQADQEKINGLLADAKKLNSEITSAAGAGSSEISKAKERETEIYSAESEVLKKNAEDHENNAKRAQDAQAGVAAQLRETQAAITDISQLLNKDYEVKIGIEPGSLSAVQATFSELTRPETKTITIQTINAGAPAQATGGPAGQPTGQPWRFNSGGYTNRSGKLPGYGGGDKIRALLEAGEFIVRKEAVNKLGLPFMNMVNAGHAPAGDVIKRKFGGSVSSGRSGGYDMKEEMKKLKDERDKQTIETMLKNGISLGTTRIGGFSRMTMNQNMGKILRNIGREDLGPKIGEIMNNSLSRTEQIGTLGFIESAQVRQDKFDRAKVLTSHLFDAPQQDIAGAPKANKIAIPKISIPVPSIPEVAAGSKLLQGAQATQKTINMQFIAPGGETVTGQFDEGDASKMISLLKSAGMRTQ